jgi:WD40 repeat protein
MAMEPRVGVERIALQLPGGESIELTRRVQELGMGGPLFTQRVFLVAPDGRHLAYAGHGGRLRLRGPDGRERVVERVNERDVRFSADSRHLATLVTVQPAESGEMAALTVFELGAPAAEPAVLGMVYQPKWLEWVRGGVVVNHVEPLSNRPVLTYFPLSGRPRQLVSRDDLAPRFTAAASGTRVMFFAGHEIFTVDAIGGEPSAAGKLDGTVVNVEMSPDGSQAAIASYGKLQRWSAAGLEVLEANQTTVHTIWYSPDGRDLAYASFDRAVLLTDGGQRHELRAPSHDLQALRFRRGGDGLVVVRGRQAMLWRPHRRDLRTLASAPDGQALRGADLYRGGTVLWTLEQVRRQPAERPGAPPAAQAKAAR